MDGRGFVAADPDGDVGLCKAPDGKSKDCKCATGVLRWSI